MEGISPDLNQSIRTTLADLTRGKPWLLHQVGRVSVVAVSVANALQMDLDSMIAIRIGAEMSVVKGPAVEHWLERPLTETEQSIIDLSLEYDYQRFHRADPNSEFSKIDGWLHEEATRKFGEDLVQALESVRGLIQPVES